MNKRAIVVVLGLVASLVLLSGGFAGYRARLRHDQAAVGSDNPPPSPDLSTLVRAATSGDTAAQLQLGIHNLESTNPAPNYTEASKWLSLAAQSGNAQAQFLLGTLCQTGRGVKRDYTNALVWFEKAAAQKHAEALYNLGSLYASGRGVPHDSEKAAQYYQQAAELGDSYAQYNMAQRYELGRGTATNFVEAWKWYDRAAQGGVTDAATAKRTLESRMTQPQIQEARRAVAEFPRRTSAN
jgi:TPR repeat protein